LQKNKFMILKLYEDNPSDIYIRKTVETLEDGGVVIIPTDSVYAIVCNINRPKAIDRVAQIKGTKIEKADFSFIFNDLSGLSEYTMPMSNDVFKVLKRNLPGPFTFILDANTKIPKIFKNKKKTLGIRIPNNNICRKIVEVLGNPLMCTSVLDVDEIIEYTTDPSLIYDNYKNIVDLIIDGGYGNNTASTVVDCTNDKISILRQGEFELLRH